MRGHIRARSAGSYQITVDIGRDPVTGKRQQHVETVRGSRRLAEKRLAELILSIEEGNYTRPTGLTVGTWLAQWHQEYVAGRSDTRTADSYLSEIRGHLIPALGSISLDKLSLQDIQSYINRALQQGRLDGKGGLSGRTVHYHHRILSMALKDAVNAGHIGRNVAGLVRPPRITRKIMTILALGDVPRFLEASLGTPYSRLYYTALYTGMREGELLGLPWRGVDLKSGYISVFQELSKRGGAGIIKDVKTRYSRRRRALSPSLVQVLREHRIETEAQAILLGRELGGDDLVFAYPDGRPLDASTVTHALARVLREAGLPHLRFHDLRHSHASYLLGAGVNPKVVSERLGHASVAFTLDTYAHVMPGMQESAADSLDRLILPGLLKPENVVKEGRVECEPHRNRTCNLLIKSQLLCQLS